RAERHEGGQVSFQPVAEIIEVPEKYELAMEAALGQRLQMLLSDSGDAVVDALTYLKDQKNGRSSFFTDSFAGDNSEFSDSGNGITDENGVDQLLANVVSLPEKNREQIRRFLKDIVVVDSIRTA